MNFCSIPNNDPTDIDYLAITLQAIDENQRHVGVIYNEEGSPPRYCHLAWHHILREEDVDPMTVWVDCAFPKPVKKNFIALIKMIIKANSPQGIPYSFKNFENSFDEISGQFISKGEGSGLTCSTFIVAAFEAIHVALIDIEGWEERPDDEQWKQAITTTLIRMMYHRNPVLRPSESHVRGLMSNSGEDIRIRPEETMAAATQTPVPMPWKKTEARGRTIVAAL